MATARGKLSGTALADFKHKHPQGKGGRFVKKGTAATLLAAAPSLPNPPAPAAAAPAKRASARQLLKAAPVPQPTTPPQAAAAAPAAPPAKRARQMLKPNAPATPLLDDGLDTINDHQLRSLGLEYGIDQTRTRDQQIADLRVQGALAPDVTFKRADALRDFMGRLDAMGRRHPSDSGPLDRAAALTAAGHDPKAVVKALRTEADVAGLKKEDADTLRFLAADLTRKKAAQIPPYINDKGSIDLKKLGQANGIDITRWMPADIAPSSGIPMFQYRSANLFDDQFRYFSQRLREATGPAGRAKAIAAARRNVDQLRADHRDGLNAKGVWLFSSRQADLPKFLAEALDAANDLERLADLAAAAKVPAKKKAPTLGATTLGEVVPIDESKFRPMRIKNVLKHRGESIPQSFVHKGLATTLLRDPNRPHRPGLTRDESHAMDLYTAVAVADGLNGSLRKGRNVHGEVKIRTGETIDLDKVQRDMDSAIDSSQLAQDTVLWRGSVPSKADYRRLVPGAVYTETGYLSTSSHEKAARDIITWRMQQLKSGSGRQSVLFKILAPAGTKAALGHEALSEAVLPHGQELRVVRVDETTSPPVAVMEIIPHQAEAGVVRGRSIVDDFDYAHAVRSAPSNNINSGSGGGRVDAWLAAIRKAQKFDGKPKVVSKQELDEAVRGGGVELFRALKPAGGKTAGQLAEEYRSGELFAGTGVYGSGTYSSPLRAVAARYGEEATMLRIALRRDAKVVSYADLLKLRPRTGITATASKLADDRQAELDRVDPTDAAAIQAIIDKYALLAARQGPRSQIAGDLGRVASLLGFDAIFVPAEYRKVKAAGQPEYVILNRTATIVQEAA